MPDEVHSRPEITAQLARGVTRVLWDHGLAPQGEIWIVETKSCLEDFAVDSKWPDYLEYCDRFYFGVTEDFPQELIPQNVGLIVADGFGGAILREAPLKPLIGARRKAVTLSFARIVAQRLAFVAQDV
jgi:hypothetical protein